MLTVATTPPSECRLHVKNLLLILPLFFLLAVLGFSPVRAAETISPTKVISTQSLLSPPIFSENGETLTYSASEGLSQTAIFSWKISNDLPKIIGRLDGGFLARKVKLAHRGGGYVSLSSKGLIQYKNATGSGTAKLPLENTSFASWDISETGRWFILAGGLTSSTPILYDFETGTFAEKFDADKFTPPEHNQPWSGGYNYGAVTDNGARVFLTKGGLGIMVDGTTGEALWWRSIFRTSGILNLKFIEGGDVLVSGPFEVRNKPHRVKFEFHKAETGKLLKTFETEVLKAFAFDDSGKRMVGVTNEGSAKLFDIEGKTPPLELGMSGQVQFAAISQDSSKVVLAGASNIYFYDFNAKVAGEAAEPNHGIKPELVVQTGHTGTLLDAVFSPDETLIASSGAEGNIWIWDARSGRPIRQLNIPQGLERPNRIRFTPDQTSLIVSSLGAWRLPLDGKLGRREIPHASFGDPMFVDFAKNDEMLVAVNIGEVSTFDARTNKFKEYILQQQLEGPSLFNAAALSRNKMLLAVTESTRDQGLVSILDLSSMEVVARLPIEEDEIQAVGVTDAGDIVVVAAEERLTAYNLPAGDVLWSKEFERDVLELHISGDEKTIAAGGGSQDVALLNLTDGAFKRRIQSRSVGQRQGQVDILRFSPTDHRLLIGSNFQTQNLKFVELDRDDSEPTHLLSQSTPPTFVKFGDDPDRLWIGYGESISLWSLDEGQKISNHQTDFSRKGLVNPNDTGMMIANWKRGGTELSYWSQQGGRRVLLPPQSLQPGRYLTTTEINERSVDAQFSPSGDFIVARNGQGYMLVKTETAASLYTERGQFGTDFFYSADEKLLAAQFIDPLGITKAHIISTETSTQVASVIQQGRYSRMHILSDKRTLIGVSAVVGTNLLFKHNIETGAFSKLSIPMDKPSFVAIGYSEVFESKRGAPMVLAQDQQGNIALASLETGQSEFMTFYPERPSFAMLAPDKTTLIIFFVDGVAEAWDIKTGKKRFSLSATPTNHEAVDFSADGKHMAIGEQDGTVSLWTLAEGSFVAKLVETSVDDWAVVDGKGRFDSSDPGDTAFLSWRVPGDPETPQPLEIFLREYFEPGLLNRILQGEVFPDIPPPANRDLNTPNIEFVNVELDGPDTISVTLKVQNPKAREAGKILAKDVKLFRDGQIVRLAKGNAASYDKQPDTGELVLHFEKIKIPVSETVETIRLLSAYAFNEDGIKGETARFPYTYEGTVSQRKKMTYIVSIGVDNYENRSWNLNYAAADARLMSGALTKRLANTEQFDEIVQVQLLSTVGKRSTATKGHIKAVLNRLRGEEADQKLLNEIPNGDLLREANPEDMVLVTFSGHGLKTSDGKFHLFTSDIAQGTRRTIDNRLLQSTLTGDELSRLLTDVDAGQLVLILDACNSAASIDGPGFKPGPMGSRGLGQLAYDKRMQVLAASQAEEVALESEKLGHGVLTYALMVEGIENQKADRLPKDGRIDLTEWLSWGVERVPELYSEVKEGVVEVVSQRGFESLSLGLQKAKFKELVVQQPRLFDFTSRNDTVTLTQFN